MSDIPSRISWLTIPTANRPRRASRAAAGFAENASYYGRSINLLISDDASTCQANESVKHCLRTRLQGSGQPILYCGPNEKRSLIKALAVKCNIPREILAFAVLGPPGYIHTVGANRNSILLQTAGSMLLSVDDDTVCRPCTPPLEEWDPKRAVKVHAKGDPTSFWFFPDRKAALAFVRYCRIDVVSAHEKLLGKLLRDLLPSTFLKAGLEVTHACTRSFESLSPDNGRILITVNGSVGDSGIYSSKQLPILCDPSTRNRLTSSIEVYRSALISREVLRQVSTTTVCHSGPLMGMFLGIDNRDLVPPFFPVCRNQDGAFSALLSCVLRESWRGHLSWAMLHDSPGRRWYAKNPGISVRISDILIACCAAWGCLEQKTIIEARLQSLGRYLIEIASMNARDFQEFVRVLICRQTGQRIAYMESLLQRHGSVPSYWASGVRTEIAMSKTVVTNPDYASPIDLTHPLPYGRFLEAQHLLQCYGYLLDSWPAIFRAAKELNAGGASFACRII